MLPIPLEMLHLARNTKNLVVKNGKVSKSVREPK